MHEPYSLSASALPPPSAPLLYFRYTRRIAEEQPLPPPRYLKSDSLPISTENNSSAPLRLCFPGLHPQSQTEGSQASAPCQKRFLRTYIPIAPPFYLPTDLLLYLQNTPCSLHSLSAPENTKAPTLPSARQLHLSSPGLPSFHPIVLLLQVFPALFSPPLVFAR